MTADRLQTGNERLDTMLGGGLLPGTMTVVLGATGIGKSQLGLKFAHHGFQQEGETGIVFDMTTRGDSQHHTEYAQRMFDWDLSRWPIEDNFDPDRLWDREAVRRDHLHVFSRSGRRVTREDVDTEAWQEWKADLNRKLQQTVAFFYGNFAQGVRRCVVDGVEPVDRQSESFQMHVFDYVYHQILRKESEWVARDVLREKYRVNEAEVASRAYDHTDIGCLLLLTSHEVLLDDLLARPIETGDVLSNANTILLMGKVRDGLKMTRALHVAKHRGSACDDAIVPFDIDEGGLVLA